MNAEAGTNQRRSDTRISINLFCVAATLVYFSLGIHAVAALPLAITLLPFAIAPLPFAITLLHLAITTLHFAVTSRPAAAPPATPARARFARPASAHTATAAPLSLPP